MLHPEAPCGLENREGADDVGVDVRPRLFEAVADARLGSEMDDYVGLKGGHGLLERCLVLEQCLGCREVRFLQQPLVAPTL